MKSSKDWWSRLDEHWIDLLNIFGMFLPMHEEAPATLHSKVSFDNPAVAPNAWIDVEQCKQNRDREKLLQYLYAAWESAPDHRSIHTIPAWEVLCDLLSESWCLEPEVPPLGGGLQEKTNET